MVRYGLFVTADLDNLTDLQPAGDAATPHYLKLKFANCGEFAKDDLSVCFGLDRTIESNPHVTKKCHFCAKAGYVKALPASLIEKDSVAHFMELECNGFVPIDFVLGKGWKAYNPKSGSKFNVDLSNADFCEYDAKGNCAVEILGAVLPLRFFRQWLTKRLALLTIVGRILMVTRAPRTSTAQLPLASYSQKSALERSTLNLLPDFGCT